MPHIEEVAVMHNVRTAEYSIIRLHGPDKQGMENLTGGLWGEIVEPKEDGLRAAVSLISENARDKLRTFMNVNNYYEGCAPMTIQRLVGFL